MKQDILEKRNALTKANEITSYEIHTVPMGPST